DLFVISPKSIEEAKMLAATLAPSAVLPAALHQKPADVLAIVLTGAELGLAPMQAIRGIKMIKGVPTLSADIMAALVKSRRDVCEYLVCIETSATRCSLEAKRHGDPRPTTLVYTMEQAQKAGLSGQDTYRKHPDAMLRARATSAICRLVFPDLVAGLYDPSEIDTESPIQGVAPPLERDVTPTNGKRTEAVKASLQAKAAAQTVDATPDRPDRKMKIVEVAPGETEEQAKARAKVPQNGEALAVRKRVKAALEAHDLRGQPAVDFVARITGKVIGHDANDLALIQAALAAEFAQPPPPPDSEPPPPGDEEAPF
ncbi:MAG: recombinase RecT, partial [Elusimicrobia bacterium]|nr:recombinase RecT [Elusimicrobiota bacterium]